MDSIEKLRIHKRRLGPVKVFSIVNLYDDKRSYSVDEIHLVENNLVDSFALLEIDHTGMVVGDKKIVHIQDVQRVESW